MTKSVEKIDLYLTELIKKQDLAAELNGEVNHPVRSDRMGKPGQYPKHQKVPRCIYFYYVRYIPDVGLDVRHYFYPGGPHDDRANPPQGTTWRPIPNTRAGLEQPLKDLIANARVDGNAFPRVGQDFQNIKWYRKSYIAVFIDDEAWKLHRHPLTGKDAIVFLTDAARGPAGAANYSFFDAEVLDLTVGGRQRPVFVCINHMTTDDAGTDVATSQHFVFEVLLRADFKGVATAPITIILDPDGNNMGPPIGPP
jgi:hypothetical protein